MVMKRLIRVSDELYDCLVRKGRMGETFDGVIKRLLKSG